MFRSLIEYASATGFESDEYIRQLLTAESRSNESINDVAAYVGRKLPGTKGLATKPRI